MNYSGAFCELGYDELEGVNGGSAILISLIEALVAYLDYKSYYLSKVIRCN
ncbi:hypothetical protein [Clostridium sp. DL1XJH146]